MPSKVLKIIILILGLLLFVTVLNFSFGLFRFPFISINPIQAIPNQSAIIIKPQINNKLLDYLKEMEGLNKLPLYKNFEKDLGLMKSIFGDSLFIEGEIETLISLQKIGSKNLDFLYALDVRDLEKSKEDIFKKLEVLEVKNLNYQGATYQQVRRNSGDEFTVYYYRNLVLLSRHPILIEDGIRQLKDYRSNLSLDVQFSKIFNKQNKDDVVAFYLSFQNLPKEINSFFKYKDQKVLSAIPNFGSWITFGLKADSSSINGSYLTTQPFQSREAEKGKDEMELLKVVPDNIGLLFAQQGAFLNGMEDPLYQEYMAPWIADEWAFSIMNPKTSADRLLILKTKNPEISQHYLKRFGRLHGELSESVYQTYPLIRWLENDCINPFLDHLQLDLENPYFTIIDRCVIFSKSKQAIETAIDKHIVGQTVYQNEAFLKYLNGVSDKSNAIFYFDGGAVGHILRHMVGDRTFQTLKESVLSNLVNMNGGCELFNGKREIAFEITHNFKELTSNKTETAWKTALSGNILRKPKPVWNAEKKEYEVLVVDHLHNLYMLNNNGEILWKRALRDSLLSEIYQIDYHEDGNLKLFFNTSDKIYLLDREGKDIGNYPLHLQSPALNGMCVVDFKGDKKYQMFLACKNEKAYGFTKEGNPIFGWNPKNNIGKVVLPFQHFRNKDKDYVIVLNDEGVLMTFDKNGQNINKRINLGSNYKNKPEILGNDKSKVIALTNEKGHVKIINNRGYTYNLEFQKNKNTQKVLSTFANIIGDPNKEFITLDRNKVICYTQYNKQLTSHFEIDLKDTSDEIFEVKIPKIDYSYFGTLSKNKKQVYLFNAQNALHKDFPISGTTSFSVVDLFNNGNNILLVAYDNSLYAYHLKI